jgi:hypothetical protein
MYTYQINFEDGRTTNNLNNYTSLKVLKESYLRYLQSFGKGRKVEEVVVMKHNKIHSFRNDAFDIDHSKPVDLHNILFNL